LPGVHLQNNGIMQCTAADSDTASDTGACDHKHAAIANHIVRGKSVLSCHGRSCKQDCHARVTDYCSRCVGGIRKQTTDGMARGVAL